MDDYIDPALLEFDEKFAIGQPVPRSEDPVLLRGEGHYSDDISLPGQAYCGDGAQPPCARGHPRHRHSGGARDAGRPRDLHRGRSRGGRYRPDAGAPGHEQPRRHADVAAGQPGAGDRQGAACRRRDSRGDRRDCRGQAKDAAEAITVDIDPLPAVTRAAFGRRRRRAAALTTMCRAMSGSISISATATKVADAFAVAAHVTRLELRDNRIVVNAMEPRAAVAQLRSRTPALDACMSAARACSASATTSPPCLASGATRCAS